MKLQPIPSQGKISLSCGPSLMKWQIVCRNRLRLEVIRSKWAGELSDEQEKTIYRICQEATTNAIKHGKADQITVSIKERNNGIARLYR